MSELILLFVAAAILALILANIGIWSPRRLRVKLAALGLAALFLPLAFLTQVTLLSRPKPIELEWVMPPENEVAVLASAMKEDEAIYLWVARADAEEPRAYALPWDEEMARELHEARQEAEEKGGSVQARLSGDLQAGERMFYTAPPEALPPKQVGLGGAGDTKPRHTGREGATN